MKYRDCEISIGDPSDIDGILALQEDNMPERGGLLSVRLNAEWFADAISRHYISVARKNTRVVGYAAGTPLSRQAHIPIIQALVANFPMAESCFVYGPACVAVAERGQGLAREMLTSLHAAAGRPPLITFIRADNHVSLIAHSRMGMKELGRFANAGTPYIALSYGSLTRSRS